MAGWTKEQADAVKAAFYEFLNRCEVKSKERGWIILGQNLYGAQTRVIEAIFDGLAEDIHDFKILKSRQLGVSTVIRALMAFWAGVFEVTGVLCFDTSQHLQEARQELVDMLEKFPTSFNFPKMLGNNRYAITLTNKSRVNLISAGVGESKSSKTLGVGSAVSLAHRSELCNYGNVTGMETMRHSYARTNPNRLFIDESTAKGFNLWYDVWTEAKKDHHCKTIFCGWWSHPEQRIPASDSDFQRFGIQPLSKEEKERVKLVYAQYGHEITAEQIAWIRREMNPTAESDGDADPDFEGDGSRLEQQPWTEQDAFQMTGAVFFDAEKLTSQVNANVSRKYKTYSYAAGMEFTDFRVYPAQNAKSVELKVWEEPVEESVYVISADVAFGRSEYNDRSAVQVLRCYSDGLDQVAEYAWPLINSKQFAWVIASLEGWYGGEKSEVFRIVDINGPGEATWMELQSLKHQLAYGYFGTALAEKGLQNIQRNVRNYIYTRSDSMQPGRAWQFKAQQQLKVAIMERLRDFSSNNMLRIRSQDTIEEMRSVTREGDTIEAQGHRKDDRVYSMAMGVRCWEERARRSLITSRRTRDNEAARRRLTITDQVSLYNTAQFEAFLSGQAAQRGRLLRAQQRKSWRG